MIQFTLLTAVLASLIACQSTPKQADPRPLPKTINEAVSSEFRNPENKVRDPYRHPAETLEFFGLKPNMTVIEITPGTGWYMEILAPYLASQGQYIAAMMPDSTGEYVKTLNEKISAWKTQNPEASTNIKTVIFSPKEKEALDVTNTADMILTFRNTHGWVRDGVGENVFKSFFAALKPGGVLGVVQHRANPKTKRDPKAKSGYVREQDVIALAKKAGFKLAAQSEINANPKDTKNYPEGVWTLPPVLRLKEQEKEKYLAIGESDRMTLKFVKPM